MKKILIGVAVLVLLGAAVYSIFLRGGATETTTEAPPTTPVTAEETLVAEAKVVTTEFALRAATTLIELGGTQATLAEHNLDRHWRNARTHTVHDPVRWKPHAIGNHWLNGATPQRHASL